MTVRPEAWITAIPRPDLFRVHHALRMLAPHPLTTGGEHAKVTELADALWRESVRRNGEEEESC